MSEQPATYAYGLKRVIAYVRVSTAEQRRSCLGLLAQRPGLRSAARTPNDRGVDSPMGGRWHAPSPRKAARRLGLRE
jgi:hypothetical protein